MKQPIAFFLSICLLFSQTFAFCGFYVAKADASLFNNTSQVILARKGNKTTVTMQSDYEGDLKDFAMVVPVPEVLARDQIRVVDASIFEKLDSYSGPRLVEYYDQNPCGHQIVLYNMLPGAVNVGFGLGNAMSDSAFGVTVEAEYEVGEYDILILSAKESDGLETWLTRNGYKIPAKAASVLKPYIQNGMKFFVVKVNLENMTALGQQSLSPIQLTYHSDKFMLPIRLGMANAKADQDMIIYAFSNLGRIEPTNYRVVDIPTDREIPTFVQEEFGDFYKSLFKKAWACEDKEAVFTEYAWDLSEINPVKCDPCPFTPPTYTDLEEAGVFWIKPTLPDGSLNPDYNRVFMTRMHVRYNAERFPQDLSFQVTPNEKRFQGRYIITHSDIQSTDCEEGRPYLEKVVERREKEVRELRSLTGWTVKDNHAYLQEARAALSKTPEKKADKGNLFLLFLGENWPWGLPGIALMLVFHYLWSRRRKPYKAYKLI